MEKINKKIVKNETIKKQKGITLIALIITIVVMLILAGVAISAIVDSSLFDKTRQSAQIYENAAKDENSLISQLIEQIEDLNSDIKLTYTKENQFYRENISAVKINFKVSKLPEDINLNMTPEEYITFRGDTLNKLERSKQEELMIKYSEMIRLEFVPEYEMINDINDVYNFLYESHFTTKLCTSLEEVVEDTSEELVINTVGELILYFEENMGMGYYDYENGNLVPLLTVDGTPIFLDENLEGEFIATQNGKYNCELSLLDYVDNIVIDITEIKGGQNDPIEISTIEDLVELGINVDSGNTFEDNYFILTRNLDFNDDTSYNEPNTTMYGDINENGVTEPLKTELTTGNGFRPIGLNESFGGYFNGAGKSINNLYIKNREAMGLFGRNMGIIANLSVNDINIIKTQNISEYADHIGVIVVNNYGTIINCSTNGNIDINADKDIVGGIVATGDSIDVTRGGSIINCKSSVNIISNEAEYGYLGGIVGDVEYFSVIMNNYYVGNITLNGMGDSGGIFAFEKGRSYLKSNYYKAGVYTNTYSESTTEMIETDMRSNELKDILNNNILGYNWGEWKLEGGNYPEFEISEQQLVITSKFNPNGFPDIKIVLFGEFKNIDSLEIYCDNYLVDTVENYTLGEDYSLKNIDSDLEQGPDSEIYVVLNDKNGNSLKSNIILIGAAM